MKNYLSYAKNVFNNGEESALSSVSYGTPKAKHIFFLFKYIFTNSGKSVSF